MSMRESAARTLQQIRHRVKASQSMAQLQARQAPTGELGIPVVGTGALPRSPLNPAGPTLNQRRRQRAAGIALNQKAKPRKPPVNPAAKRLVQQHRNQIVDAKLKWPLWKKTALIGGAAGVGLGGVGLGVGIKALKRRELESLREGLLDKIRSKLGIPQKLGTAGPHGFDDPRLVAVSGGKETGAASGGGSGGGSGSGSSSGGGGGGKTKVKLKQPIHIHPEPPNVNITNQPAAVKRLSKGQLAAVLAASVLTAGAVSKMASRPKRQELEVKFRGSPLKIRRGRIKNRKPRKGQFGFKS